MAEKISAVFRPHANPDNHGIKLEIIFNQSLRTGTCLNNVIIYGGGLRLNEALSLRIKDIDLKNKTLTVRSGKGDKDRVTILAESTVTLLEK